MSADTTSSVPKSDHRVKIVRATRWMLKNWLGIFLIGYGVFWGLPFLAPILMKFGWIAPAHIIYFVYGFFCHQMAQRSYFLFGSQPMYTLSQLPVTLTNDEFSNTLLLRNFLGNAEVGWKVAWSDRMVSLYSGVLVAAILFWAFRRMGRLRLPGWYWTVPGLLPMIVDGITHWVSDLSGLETGFRYTNDWLAKLTNYALPTWFYLGDAIGSFNFWMRLITGLSFGASIGWLALFGLQQYFDVVIDVLSEKLDHELQ